MWSFCSAKCGPGKRERMRKCDNPSPKFGGNSCAGSDRQIMPCSLSDCPGKFSPKIRSCLICCKRGTFFYPILDVEIASHADVLRASLTSAWEANVEVSFWKICPQINAMKWNVHMSTGPEFEGNSNLRVTSALSTTSPLLANLMYLWFELLSLKSFLVRKIPSIALSRVSGRRLHHGVSSR